MDTLAIFGDYQYLLLSDNTQLRCVDKINDMLYLLAHGHLIAYHLQSVEDAAVTLVDNTVGVTDVFDDFRIHTFMLQDKGVHAVVGGRLLSCHDIRRQVFAEAAAGLRHRPCTYAASLAHQHVAAEDYAVLEEAVAGDLAAVTKHAMIADMRVVRDMHTLVQEVSIADEGLPARVGGAVDHHVLANHIVVANDNNRFIALIIEVLRLCRNDSTVEHPVVLSQTRTAHNAGVRHNLAVVTNHNILIDISKGVHRNVCAQFCIGIYIS